MTYFKDIHIDIKTTIILLSAPILLTIYRYHGYPEFFTKYFSGFEGHELLHYYDRIWQFGVFFSNFSYKFRDDVSFGKIRVGFHSSERGEIDGH